MYRSEITKKLRGRQGHFGGVLLRIVNGYASYLPVVEHGERGAQSAVGLLHCLCSKNESLASANSFDTFNGAQLFDELIEHCGVFHHNGEDA